MNTKPLYNAPVTTKTSINPPTIMDYYVEVLV